MPSELILLINRMFLIYSIFLIIINYPHVKELKSSQVMQQVKLGQCWHSWWLGCHWAPIHFLSHERNLTQITSNFLAMTNVCCLIVCECKGMHQNVYLIEYMHAYFQWCNYVYQILYIQYQDWHSKGLTGDTSSEFYPPYVPSRYI